MADKTKSAGVVTVKLAKPVNVGGSAIDAMNMREPTVADQLAAEEYEGGDAAREIHMLANLCTVTPDEIKQLTLRDYKKLQQAFSNFLD